MLGRHYIMVCCARCPHKTWLSCFSVPFIHESHFLLYYRTFKEWNIIHRACHTYHWTRRLWSWEMSSISSQRSDHHNKVIRRGQDRYCATRVHTVMGKLLSGKIPSTDILLSLGKTASMKEHAYLTSRAHQAYCQHRLCWSRSQLGSSKTNCRHCLENAKTSTATGR